MKQIGHFTRVQEQLIAKHILQAELSVEKILWSACRISRAGYRVSKTLPVSRCFCVTSFAHLQISMPVAEEIKFLIC